MHDPVQLLSEDVLVRIFKEVIGDLRAWCPYSSYQYPLVCTRWRNFLNSPTGLWADVRLYLCHVSNESSSWKDALQWLAKRSSGMRRLKVELPFSPPVCLGLTRMLLSTQLKVLVLDGVGRAALDLRAMAAIGSLVSLEMLELVDLPPEMGIAGLKFFGRLRNLRELFVSAMFKSGGDISLPVALCGLTRLQKLVLRAEVHTQEFLHLQASDRITSLTKLKVLILDGYWIRDPQIFSLSSLSILQVNCDFPASLRCTLPSRLEQLILCYSKALPNLEACTMLRRLEVRRCRPRDVPSELILAEVLGRMQLLERLDIELTPSNPPSLASLPNLKVLRWHTWHDSDAAVDTAVAVGDSYLSRLEVLGLGRLRTLPSALHKAANLRVLDASGIQSFKEDQAQLVLELPKLQELYLPPRLQKRNSGAALVQLAQQASKLRVKIGFPAPTAEMSSAHQLVKPSPCYQLC